jgi:hypothetical protein
MSTKPRSPNRRDWRNAVRTLLGSIIVAFLMLQVYYAGASLIDGQIVRFLAALAAGLLFEFIGGKIIFKAKIRSVVVSGAQAAGIFALVYLMWELPTGSSSSAVRKEASVRSATMELEGAVLFHGQKNGSWALLFQETGEYIKSDDNGYCRVKLINPPAIVHVQASDLPYPFEIRLPESAKVAYVQLDVTQPGLTFASVRQEP